MLSGRALPECRQSEPRNYGVREGFKVNAPGDRLTLSEPGSNDLGTITAADPTGLLVATPAEGDPNFLSVREYKGY